MFSISSLQQESQRTRPTNMSEMIHRLRTRLALAAFKQKHGYEAYDLQTLEYALFPVSTLSKLQTHSPIMKKKPLHINNTSNLICRHRYYPTSSSYVPTTAAANNLEQYTSHISHNNNKSKLKLPLHNSTKNSSDPNHHLLLTTPKYPISEKRSTSPRQPYYTSPLILSSLSLQSSSPSSTFTPTDEDLAANVLVMLHNDTSRSSPKGGIAAKSGAATAALC